jgi:Protein of unknown function (DUF2809)
VPTPRSRLLYSLLIVVTIILGLSSRRYAAFLPWWAAKNAGDALYATMAFFLVGFLRPRVETWRAALAALTFCFLIELSQAIHVGWLDAIRATRLGALVLGQGFHALDLFDYVVGVALGVAVERAARR